MILRRFRIRVLVRSLLLAATLGLACLFAFTQSSFLWAGISVLFAAYQVATLIRYIEKTNRDLTRLLDAIRYSDFSQGFTSGGRGKHYLELTNAFRGVMDDFREARAEKEEGYRYLETVMQHVGTGLISFDYDGNVNLINSAAKRLLNVPHLTNINALKERSPELVAKLGALDYGSKDLLKVSNGEEVLQLSIYATGFKIRGDVFKLVSLQDIGGELDEAEALAWRKLTRVLTHEIMNSVAPISSLASTAASLLHDQGIESASKTNAEPAHAADETMSDVRGAVDTIARRSDGLLRFVNEYRRLTRVPPPNLSVFPVRDLFDAILDLYRKETGAAGIQVSVSVEPTSLTLTADRDLIEQTMINLVKNAVQALAGIEQPRIELRGFIDTRSRAVIEVIDNGCGIVEEAMDKLFVPFFTTKKEGSGIGLSLAREIMRQHGGAISATSAKGANTVFRLRF